MGVLENNLFGLLATPFLLIWMLLEWIYNKIKNIIFKIFGIDDSYFVPSAEYYNFLKQGHSKKKARELTERQRRKRWDIENSIYEQKRKKWITILKSI